MTVIYSLLDPVSGLIRYIGKTKNPKTRLASHIKKAASLQTDHHCARWIRTLLAEGKQPALEILHHVSDGEKWQDAEARLIAEYRAAGHPLTNMTAGGDGFHDVLSDVLLKRSASRRKTLSDPEARAKFVARLTASRATPEVRAAKSESARKAWADPEKRKRLLDGARDPAVLLYRSEFTRKRNADPDFKARQSAAMKLVWGTPEGRAAQSLRSLNAWSGEEKRLKRIAAQVEAQNRPDVYARVSLAREEMGRRPEVRASKSAAMKAAWLDPEYRAKMHDEAAREKMSAKAKVRWRADPESMLAVMNDPARTAKISKAMTLRNADPAFRAKVQDPEVRARAAATLKATWARRKAEAAAAK